MKVLGDARLNLQEQAVITALPSAGWLPHHDQTRTEAVAQA